jgi:hypothetical protein
MSLFKNRNELSLVVLLQHLLSMIPNQTKTENM